MMKQIINFNQKDTIFDDLIIFKLISSITKNGNYIISEKIIYNFFKEINMNIFKTNKYFFKILKKKYIFNNYFITYIWSIKKEVIEFKYNEESGIYEVVPIEEDEFTGNPYLF